MGTQIVGKFPFGSFELALTKSGQADNSLSGGKPSVRFRTFDSSELPLVQETALSGASAC